MENFSEKFNQEGLLEFFDPILGKDTRSFIDPYLIYKQNDDMSTRCSNTIVNYFQKLLEAASTNDSKTGLALVKNLHEIRELHLGYAEDSNKGLGVGKNKGMELFKIISNSEAVKTGLVKDIFDTSIMLDKVADDKVSDLTANIILKELIEFTQSICRKRNISMQEVNFNKYIWDSSKNEWVYVKKIVLPYYEEDNTKIGIILIPKEYVRSSLAYSLRRFYNEVMMPFYEKQAINNPSYGLVKILSRGEIKPSRTKIRSMYPCTKININNFIKNNPASYFEYKEKILKYAELNNI